MLVLMRLVLVLITSLALSAQAGAHPPFPKPARGERFAYGAGFRYGSSNNLVQLAIWAHVPATPKAVCDKYAAKYPRNRALYRWGCLDGVKSRR